MRALLLLVLATDGGTNALRSFQKTEWGMTEGAVERLYPGGTWILREPGSGVYAVEKFDFASFASKLSFTFNATGLRGAGVVLKTTADVKQTWAALRTSLIEKYGEPRDRPVDRAGDSLLVWSSESTELTLFCRLSSGSGSPLGPGVRLDYRSLAEGPAPKVKKDDL